MLTICLEWGRSFVAWILRGLDTAWEGMVSVKGPYERLKYDLRRVWACPVCQHRERTGGEFTSWLCPCQASVEPAQRRYMTLVEDGCRRLIPRAPMEFGEEWYAAIEVPELPMVDEDESADRIAPVLADDEEHSDEVAADEAATDDVVETEFESDESDADDAETDARLSSLAVPNAAEDSSIAPTPDDAGSVDAGSVDAGSGTQTPSDGTGPQPAASRGNEKRRGRGRKSRRRRRGS